MVVATAVGASLILTGSLLAKGGPEYGKGEGKKGKKPKTASTIVLPGDAVFPEGIAAKGRYVYVGSSQDGTIFRATRRGETAEVLSGPGRDTKGRTSAIGMKVDRNGHLVVAGGATGVVWILDRDTGATLGKLTLPATGQYTVRDPTFLNDLVITKNGDAYVTDSFSAVIWRIPAATLAAPPAEGTLEPWLLLDGSPIVYQNGFNLNGIVAWKNKYLLVVQTNTGKLFRIKISTKKEVVEVPVSGGSILGGDGMILHDERLYVVNDGAVDVLKMKKRLTRAKLRQTITDPTFDSPTTAALFKGRLYVVNSQFGKQATKTAAPPFTVSVLKPGRGRGHGHGHGEH
jgi:Cu-Zn family superoxide dismutase